MARRRQSSTAGHTLSQRKLLSAPTMLSLAHTKLSTTPPPQASHNMINQQLYLPFHRHRMLVGKLLDTHFFVALCMTRYSYTQQLRY